MKPTTIYIAAATLLVLFAACAPAQNTDAAVADTAVTDGAVDDAVVSDINAVDQLVSDTNSNDAGTPDVHTNDVQVGTDVVIDAAMVDAYVPLQNHFYVNVSNGVDSAQAGTAQQPFLTIQYAINQATAPAQVHVAAGRYDQSVIMKPGVSLLGGYNNVNWGDRNIIDRDNSVYKTSIYAHLGIGVTIGQYAERDTVLEGFDIHGGYDEIDHHSYGIYLYDECSPTLRYNSVEGGTGDTYAYGIGVYGSTALIVANSISGGSTELTYGIICQNESAPIIVANRISGDSATDISYGVLLNNCDAVLSNNTINGGNPSNDSYAVFMFANASAVIENNILSTSGGTNRHCIYEFGMNTRPALLQRNDFFDCPSSLYRAFGSPGTLTTIDAVNNLPNSASVGNISVNPEFRTSDDWHLRVSSPVEVREGGGNTMRVAIDHDGVERTDPTSLGAYEIDVD